MNHMKKVALITGASEGIGDRLCGFLLNGAGTHWGVSESISR